MTNELTVYLRDLSGLWQSETYEKTNGQLRKYFSKDNGTAIYAQN